MGNYSLLQGIFLTQESNLGPCIAGKFFTNEPPGLIHQFFVMGVIILVSNLRQNRVLIPASSNVQCLILEKKAGGQDGYWIVKRCSSRFCLV